MPTLRSTRQAYHAQYPGAARSARGLPHHLRLRYEPVTLDGACPGNAPGEESAGRSATAYDGRRVRRAAHRRVGQAHESSEVMDAEHVCG